MTPRQKQCYEFIVQHIYDEQCPPTVRAIGEHMGIKSPNGVYCHLKALQREGFIELAERQRACGIRLVPPPPEEISEMKWLPHTLWQAIKKNIEDAPDVVKHWLNSVLEGEE